MKSKNTLWYAKFYSSSKNKVLTKVFFCEENNLDSGKCQKLCRDELHPFSESGCFASVLFVRSGNLHFKSGKFSKQLILESILSFYLKKKIFINFLIKKLF